MNAKWHVDEAEKALRHIELAEDPGRRTEDLAEAQAHATIALAIATIALADVAMEVPA